MQIKTIRWVIILLIAAAGIHACKEDPDESWPEVKIISPSSGSAFHVCDTIIVEATFSDDRALENVKIALVGENSIPLTAPVSAVPNSNPYTFRAELIIDDASLTGGAYKLLFQASDGTNTTNKYLTIYLEELPEELLYPVVVTAVGSNQIRIMRTDTNDVFQSLYLYQGDYGGSDVCSAFGQLYFAGKAKADMKAYSLLTNKFLWSVPCEQSMTGHWFEGVQCFYRWVLVSHYDGLIRGYDRNGIQQFTSQPVSNYYPGPAIMISPYIVVSMKEYNSPLYQIAVFHTAGGKLIDVQPVSFIPAAFEPAGAKKVFIFGNLDGDGVIALYDLVTSNLSVLKTIRDHNINDVDIMSDNVFYFAAGDEIYCYTYQNNSVIPFAGGYENARISCEKLSGQVYAASGNSLYVLNPPDGSVEKTYSFNDPVLNVHLVYNK